MKLCDNQTFLSLYYAPNAVEVATGECDSFASVESWQRETKQMGQVATPEPVAAVMAKWVMSAKPHTVLDPAAGLGGLLSACSQLDARVQLVGVERDMDTLQRAKKAAPRGAKLILADYLKSDAGLFEDRKSTRLNSSHTVISYAVFCLKQKILCRLVAWPHDTTPHK